MIDEHWSDRLSAYLDDELSAADRARADEHFRACEPCRRAREDFLAVRHWVRSSPPPVPASDPWPAIADRIGTTRRTSGSWLRWAASVVLPAVIGAGVWWARTSPEPMPPQASSPAIARGEAGLRAEITTLELRFQDVEPSLDPRTAAAIREGLAELDAAVRQAERELERNGDRPLVEALIARAQRQKLRLLQSMTAS